MIFFIPKDLIFNVTNLIWGGRDLEKIRYEIMEGIDGEVVEY